MKWKEILSKALLCLFIIVCIAHVTLLYYGIAYITTTISLYVLLALILYKCIGYIGNKYNLANYRNIQLSIISFLLFMFIGELTLRYVVKLNITRKENLSGFYSSEYKRHLLRIDYNKYVRGFNLGWYFVNQPYSQYSSSGSEFNNTFTYNSQGINSKEISPTDTTPLIITLGDSYTEGVGTAQDSAWPYLLGYIYNLDSLHTSTNILNAGKNGSDVCFEYIYLQKLLLTYKPKTVVVSTNTSDIDDIIIRGGMERFKADSTMRFKASPWWEPLYATSFIARALFHAVLHIDWTLLTKEQKKQATQRAVAISAETIGKFSELAQQHHFKLVVMLNPLVHEMKSISPLYKQISSNVKDIDGLNFIDLRDAFIKDGRITPSTYQNYYWPEDKHHNSAGYKIWAEIVASHLQETTK